MQTDPSPLPEQAKILFQAQKDPYDIKVCSSSRMLIFTILHYTDKEKKRYEDSFTLAQLATKSKWFDLFDSMDIAAREIAALFQSNKFKITAKRSNAALNINFFIESRVITEVDIEISLREEIKNNAIEIICFKLNTMNKMLNAQSEKFAVLEQSARYQSMIDRVHQLQNYKGGLLTEGIKALVFKGLPFASEIKFNLIYSAAIDGDSNQNFHSFCDGCGPTLTIVKTNRDVIIGGYTSISWKQNDYNFVYDRNMFLFSGTLNKVYNLPSSRKYVSFYNYLNFAYSYLVISGSVHINQSSCNFDEAAKCGFTYEEFLNCDDKKFTIKEFDVYQVNIIKEYSKFSIRYLKSFMTLKNLIVSSISILLISYLCRKYL